MWGLALVLQEAPIDASSSARDETHVESEDNGDRDHPHESDEQRDEGGSDAPPPQEE